MSAQTASDHRLPRLATEIPGFDSLAAGGVPRGHSVLLAGTAGTGKTLFALQFILGGIESHGQAGVFVAFEESVADASAGCVDAGLGPAGPYRQRPTGHGRCDRERA